MRRTKGRKEKSGTGLVILKDVREAMRAEKILRSGGYDISMVAPPPEVRTGCDLAIEFDLIEQLAIERSLNQYNIKPIGILSVNKIDLRPSELTKEVDFGKYLMVRAGNVKLTFEKDTGIIVNISGGGCPDIPYLNIRMLNKHLTQAPRPKEVGYTLCAYMLDKAYERALELFRDGSRC